MNTITFFFATLALVSSFVIASENNSDVGNVEGTNPPAVSRNRNPVPPPAPPIEDITIGD